MHGQRSVLGFLLAAILGASPPMGSRPKGAVDAEEAGKRAPEPASKADGRHAPGLEKTEKPPPLFLLRDGSRVAGLPDFEHLVVTTRYGVLRIPPADLVQVRLVPRASAPDVERIEKAIAGLGAEDVDERERAMTVLRSIGAPARRHLRKASVSATDEVKSRVGVLLGEIGRRGGTEGGTEVEIEPIEDDEDDEVVTHRFTVRGRVEGDRIAVTSPYGGLELSLLDIEAIVFAPERSGSRALRVSASSTAPDAWMRTRFVVAKGQQVILRAKGSLSVPNYNLTSGPEGNRRYSGTTFGSFPMLSLVGKIGKSGSPFLVGREYKGKAPRDGELYLGIVPFRRNLAATGSYQVKVEGKP